MKIKITIRFGQIRYTLCIYPVSQSCADIICFEREALIIYDCLRLFTLIVHSAVTKFSMVYFPLAFSLQPNYFKFGVNSMCFFCWYNNSNSRLFLSHFTHSNETKNQNSSSLRMNTTITQTILNPGQ